MSENIKVSVIIITLNSEKDLGELLQSLYSQSLKPGEIIVVDGGSTDKTVELAKQWGCKVHIAPKSNRAKARNIGVKIAQFDIVAFIDSDCIAEKDWLRNLVQKLINDNNDLAGVSGKVLAANREKIIPRLIELAGSKGVHYATWNIAYWRKIILEVGGFDERLHVAEDQALAWKIIRKGYRIGWEPNAIVYHKHRDSLLAYLKQQYNYGKWSVIAKRLYRIKYYPSLMIIFLWPILFLFKYLRTIKRHPLLPLFLTLSSIAYSLGAWRGFLCRSVS